MGMCSNVKKSPQKNEEENPNTVKIEKNTTEKEKQKSEKNIIQIPIEEEFKDMEEWEGKSLLKK
jgi:hypothetical protein